MAITADQIRMARAALRWGVRDLATKAQVSPNTVSRIEGDQDANAATLAAIQGALEKAGVVFIDSNGGGTGVRLKRKPKR
jgi:transcriptional regulator with XRE-family HTH domain